MELALEFPESEMFARIIWQATLSAWDLCLGGQTWPNKERQYQRMKSPEPGDMVVEQSAGLRALNCADAVGWLIKTAREPMPYEDWDVAADGPIPLEQVYYIRTIEGDEMRWTNASFLQVPTRQGWWDSERWKEKADAAFNARHADSEG